MHGSGNIMKHGATYPEAIGDKFTRLQHDSRRSFEMASFGGRFEDFGAIAFHQSHFSADAVTNFATSFTNLPPKDEELILHPHGWEDEDDLGFYHDGVKRTLTDEQIEIFRHSELRELQKRQEKAKASKSKAYSESGSAGMNGSMDASAQDAHAHSSRGVKKKKKMKKGGRNAGHEPRPDLRKRTWDVVDAGLDSLNYD